MWHCGLNTTYVNIYDNAHLQNSINNYIINPQRQIIKFFVVIGYRLYKWFIKKITASCQKNSYFSKVNLNLPNKMQSCYKEANVNIFGFQIVWYTPAGMTIMEEVRSQVRPKLQPRDQS